MQGAKQLSEFECIGNCDNTIQLVPGKPTLVINSAPLLA